MAKIKKLFLWYLLLNKRFLKKPGLWAILIAVPLLVAALNLVSLQDSGVITISLVAEDKTDSTAAQIVDELTKDNRLIRFIVTKTAADAEKLVSLGKADAAWILPPNIEKGLEDFLSVGKSVVRIIEREETVPLMLARQKLSGVIFKKCSPNFYINYARRNFPEFKNLTDEELTEYYNKVKVEGDELFEFSYANSNQSTNDAAKAGYLMTPVRGLLALMLLLSGLAAAMFYNDDEKSGTFSWIGEKSKPFVAGVFHIIPVSLTALFVLISLYFSGLWVGILREALILFLYAVVITLFCMIVRLICKSNKVIGAATPITMLVFMFICPVFIDLSVFRPIQVFLPTFHYLSAVHNDNYIIGMLIYILVSSGVYFILSRVTKRA